MKKFIIATIAILVAGQAGAFQDGGNAQGSGTCGYSSSYANCMSRFQRVDQQPEGLVSVYACNAQGNGCMFGAMTQQQLAQAEQRRLETGKPYLQY